MIPSFAKAIDDLLSLVGKWRTWLIYLVFCSILGMAASAWFGVLALRDAAEGYRTYPLNGLDAAFKLDVDYHRFAASLGRLAADDGVVDPSEVALQFDLLWARADLVSGGSAFADVLRATAVRDVAADLLTILREIEPLVLALGPGDVEGARDVYAVLDPLAARLAATVAETEAVRSVQDATLRLTLVRIFDRFADYSLAFLAAMALLIGLLLIEARRSRRSRTHMALRDAEARFLEANDKLTGLPNRASFAELLERRCQELPESPFALILVDLDDFKVINDQRGHQRGDDILRAFAKRIKGVCRRDDFVARLDGDEFALIADADDDAAAAFADGLVGALARPLDVDGEQFEITASLGVVCAPTFGDDSEKILACADMAINRAKYNGKGRAEIYAAQLGAAVQRERHLKDELKAAVVNNDFSLVYQPCIRMATGEIEKVEALVRWTSPSRGPVSPGEFIPVAEGTGLITEIGEWVLREACARVASWTGPAAGLGVAVNVSPIQFARRDVVAEVRAALADSGLKASRLELEITEGMVIDTTINLRAALEEVRELGVKVAVDDFGTGYSNLGYLRRFPIDRLKIDRSFVVGLGVDPDITAIAHGIVRLARSLHLATTAEGVEERVQAETLSRWGCETAQGFGYARPMPEADLLAWLARPDAGKLAKDEAPVA